MDAAAVFQQGLGSVVPRPQYYYHHQAPPPFPQPVQQHHAPLRRPPTQQRDDDDGNSHRIAHTLTACCRCRQRKTRCDPTLPRCLPCERSGSVCEYFDTTRGKKISRFYVVKLQEKVRQLEAELSQYTDEDIDYTESAEDVVRPGGLVKLNESDETPRYLGPSSGIAMTRLLMDQAKRYTDTQRISELIPDVRARRMDRMQRMQSVVNLGASISGPSGAAARKKEFPMISEHPAQTLPSRQVTDKLIEIFNSRAQFFTPTLHEKIFAKDLEDVYEGTTDPYKNFVVRMVLAISLQKLDIQYAGLADSYYLAAMQYFEEVVRPKDLKTLQCLVLIGSYSLLTPTRNVVYHIIGLATRICQQLGLADEKTISAGYSMGLVDDLHMDMRRRLLWIVTGNELGLAHAMGRPNGFAKGDDFIDVKFFATVDDEHITEEGIHPGPQSEKKLVAIHFCKMRIRQAEIRRVLYEKKRQEPRDSNSPVFVEMERKIQDWLDTAPEEPVWCKPWFTGRYHTMVISLHRPSPQIPRPSARSAAICYESAVHIINLSNQQVKKSAIDITWVFVLTLNMSLNVLLWAISYREVRDEHAKDEAEEILNVALDVVDQCAERWPGTQNASQLYSILGRACLQSYDTDDDPLDSARSVYTSPVLRDGDSPAASDNAAPTPTANGASYAQNQQRPVFTQPVFGYSVDAPENMNVFNFEPNPFQQPTFRSNSIFKNPSTDSPEGRRPSFGYFPPDFKQPSPGEPPAAVHQMPPPVHAQQTHSPRLGVAMDQLPTPPDSNTAGSNSFSPPTMSPGTAGSPTPKMAFSSPMPLGPGQQQVPPGQIKYEPGHDHPPSTPNSQPTPQQTPQQPSHPTPTFAVPPLPAHVANGQRHPHQPQQRPHPQPTTVSDWFSPPPPFISPFNNNNNTFNGINSASSFWNESTVSNAAFSGLMGGGGGYEGTSPTSAPGGFSHGMPPGGFGFAAQRHGSLSADQQLELMNILETDGVGEINNFLGMDMGGMGGAPDHSGHVRWH